MEIGAEILFLIDIEHYDKVAVVPVKRYYHPKTTLGKASPPKSNEAK